MYEDMLFSSDEAEEIYKDIKQPKFKAYNGCYIPDALREKLKDDASILVFILYKSQKTQKFFIYKYQIKHGISRQLKFPIQILTDDETSKLLADNLDVYKKLFDIVKVY